MLRAGLETASWISVDGLSGDALRAGDCRKDRKPVAAALKVYRATDAEAGRVALDAFAEGPWGRQVSDYRPILAAELGRGDPVLRVSGGCPPNHLYDQRHRKPERENAPGGADPRPFPTDDSALKLLYLVLNLTAKDWKMPPREWGMAKVQFAILFEDRFTLAG